MAPKSILKKPAASEEATPSAAKTRDDRNREIALYHANLIQAQKDVEAEIFASLEVLIDFPTDPQSTSVHPAEKDIAEFKKRIHPFTPSDYDELIEERRIDNKCGYVFCSNAPKKTAGGGKFKIVGKQKGGEFKVLDRAKSECWCSTDCAKRALYIKVQLIEEPAWSRRGGTGGPQLEIITGNPESEDFSRGKTGKEQPVHGSIEDALRDLELERGDKSKPARALGMIANTLVEKDTVKAPSAPQREEDDEAGGLGSIEGYAPKTGSSKQSKADLGDVEWDL